MSAGESRFVAEGAIVAMRQSFFSLAILASIFPGPALAQFKSWSKEQRTFERFSGALVSALHGGCARAYPERRIRVTRAGVKRGEEHAGAHARRRGAHRVKSSAAPRAGRGELRHRDSKTDAL